MKKTIIVLAILATACSSSRPLYKADTKKELAPITILPGAGGDRTMAAICLNGEWHNLHKQYISSGVFSFDASTLTRTIDEAQAYLPTNEPILFSYYFKWSSGAGANATTHTCSLNQIVKLKQDHTYKISGGTSYKDKQCSFSFEEIDEKQRSSEAIAVRNFIPCNRFDPQKDVYATNKAYALHYIQQQKNKK